VRWYAGIVALAIAVGAASGSSTAVPVTATVDDAWTTRVTLRTPNGYWASPVHSALLPDGRVLMWGLQRAAEPPTPATRTKRAAWIFTPGPIGEPLPSEMTVSEIEEPVEIPVAPLPDGYVEDDLYCSGHVLTVDGKLFTAGGNRRLYHSTTAPESYGVDYQTVFDWEKNTWTRLVERMQGTSPTNGKSRWYPTVTKLPDGRMMIMGGFDKVLPNAVWNGTAEVWDPVTRKNVVISPYGWTPPEVMNSTYTHSFVLPNRINNRQILSFGEPGVPVFMGTNGTIADWQVVNLRPRPGSEQFNATRVQQGRTRWNSDVAPDWGASSAMLPIRVVNGDSGYNNGSVAIAGGSPQTQHVGNVDDYDPIANTWRPGDMIVNRNFPATVTLPDGRLLIVGGGGTTDPNLRHAEYLDPKAGFAETLGAADGGEVRGYHATALLLPDGRVLVGGGRDVVKAESYEKPSFRYYEPDYMTKDRPEIQLAPPTLTPGAPYAVWTSRAVQELILVALGSQTHSFDFNQRVVQVPLLANIPKDATHNIAIGGGVPGPQTVPPGYYMLFAVDDQRVPSMAKIVKVNPLSG
jgi:hypothetical protein